MATEWFEFLDTRVNPQNRSPLFFSSRARRWVGIGTYLMIAKTIPMVSYQWSRRVIKSFECPSTKIWVCGVQCRHSISIVSADDTTTWRLTGHHRSVVIVVVVDASQAGHYVHHDIFEAHVACFRSRRKSISIDMLVKSAAAAAAFNNQKLFYKATKSMYLCKATILLNPSSDVWLILLSSKWQFMFMYFILFYFGNGAKQDLSSMWRGSSSKRNERKQRSRHIVQSAPSHKTRLFHLGLARSLDTIRYDTIPYLCCDWWCS